MAHENLKVHLTGKPGQTFVATLTHMVYPWSVKISDSYINYRIFEEVSIREESSGKTRLDLDYRPHYRFDCVFFIEPGYRALNQRQVYTVGVELKNSKADLTADDKIDHYIGYTDFFFLGVPTELISDAINRAYENEDGQIGVFSVDDGKIILPPQRIKPTVEHERDLLQQIMYSRMFGEDFKNKVSFKLEDVEVIPMTFKDNIEREIVKDTQSSEEPEGGKNPQFAQNEPSGAHFVAQMGNSSTASVKEATTEATDGNSETQKETSEEERTAAKLAAKEKEQMRREKHDAKVAALQEEVSAMNEEVPQVVVSILEGLSLGDQRVYHAIRRHGGIQAQSIAEVLPYQDGVEQPSLATVKRSIRVLTDAGLVEREGSRKTGQYVVKAIDCDNDSCQVCAKSPLCRQFQEVGV